MRVAESLATSLNLTGSPTISASSSEFFGIGTPGGGARAARLQTRPTHLGSMPRDASSARRPGESKFVFIVTPPSGLREGGQNVVPGGRRWGGGEQRTHELRPRVCVCGGRDRHGFLRRFGGNGFRPDGRRIRGKLRRGFGN